MRQSIRQEIGSATLVALTHNVVVRVCFAAGILVACGRSLPEGPAVQPRTIRMTDEIGFRLIAAYDIRYKIWPLLMQASNIDELGALWRAYRLAGPLPAIDFGRFLVLAYVANGGQDNIYSINTYCLVSDFSLMPDRHLVPSCLPVPNRTHGQSRSPGPTYSVVRVIALDRRTLPLGELALMTTAEGSEPDQVSVESPLFVVEPPKFGRVAAVSADRPPASSALLPFDRTRVSPRSESTPIPPRGDVCLARLNDGSRAWVLQHRDGELSVIAGDYVVRPVHARMPWRFAAAAANGIDLNLQTGSLWNYRLPTRWDETFRSFNGLFDEYGSAIVGVLEPLDQHEFHRVDHAHVVIGERVEGRQRWPVMSFGYWPIKVPSGAPAYWDDPNGWLSFEDGAPRPMGALVRIPGILANHCGGAVCICPASTPHGSSPGSFGQFNQFALPSACAVGAPRALGIQVLNARVGELLGFAGPLLARVDRDGFSNVISLMYETGPYNAPSEKLHCDHPSRRPASDDENSRAGELNPGEDKERDAAHHFSLRGRVE